MRKQGAVHESLMNDEQTKDGVALAIQEPQARRIQGRLLTTLMGHHKWTKMVNKDIEVEQVPVESSDITAAMVRLPERLVFMASVYVEGGNVSALDDACSHLRDVITKVRRDTGAVVDILIAGDFNRHDQLWSGDEVSLGRQGEADPIIDLMNEFALSSLLKRGTKTWHGGGRSGDCESTIDLVLALENLTESMTKCATLETDHGSDHYVIESVFDTCWTGLTIENALAIVPYDGTVQQKTDRLMSVVSEAVHALTPRAKPSPHAKRWWTADLTQLHNDNIWKAAKYLRSGDDAVFGKIPQLLRANSTTTSDHKEQAEELISKFFPPLPDNIDEEGARP
ncbi:hypothetical protein N7454_009051 [Penicillium verhagenii]|nr:hypothetical protein N7454_009051 [Penicillium verhagenii]